MNREPLPVACSLTETELRERRNGLLHEIGNAVRERRELPDGYAFRFEESEEMLTRLLTLIRLERECCPFLTFRLTFEPGGGPVWLDVTGPEGTREFLASLL